MSDNGMNESSQFIRRQYDTSPLQFSVAAFHAMSDACVRLARFLMLLFRFRRPQQAQI
jgi:hypothetical protein